MARSTTRAPSSGFRATLRNRYFLRLWLAQVISQTVQNAINYGSLVLLTQQSHSFTAVGGVIIAFSLPAVIFGVPAGVLVDRVDKRALLWISNALRAIASFGFVVSLLMNNKAFIPIYILTFLISIIGQFFAPAEGAAIPLLVSEDQLVPALSLFNITFSLSQAVGFIVLGPLIILSMPTITLPIGQMRMTLTSFHWLFIFIGVMYLLCTLLTWSIPREQLIGTTREAALRSQRHIATVWHGVVEAWDYVRHSPRLFIAVFQLTLGGTLITVISMIAPLFSEQFMNRPPALAAIVFVPAGLGLIIGSVLMPRIIHHIGLIWAEAAGVVGLGSGVVLLVATHWIAHRINPGGFANYPAYLLIMVVLIFIIGLTLDLINLPAQTEMQQLSEDWIKGRVLALQMMLINAAAIPIVLIVGPVADLVGLPKAMIALAVTVVALGLGSIYLSEHPREAIKQPHRSIGTAQENIDMVVKGTKSRPLQARAGANGATPRAPLPASPQEQGKRAQAR
jgi:MFS family permease